MVLLMFGLALGRLGASRKTAQRVTLGDRNSGADVSRFHAINDPFSG